MSRINIRQVAKAAGVSTATVSRVINGTGPVKPETRDKVMSVVQQLGFYPNQLGQKLRNSQSGMLLVLASNIANPYCRGGSTGYLYGGGFWRCCFRR